MVGLFQQAITGMNLSTLGRFFWRNRRQVHWRYFPRFFYLTLMAVWNSYLILI